MGAMKLINSYLTTGKQWIKINSADSSSVNILVGVAQGSIVFFSTFLCGLFIYLN